MIQDSSLKFKLMAYPGTAHKSVAELLRKSEENFDPSVVVCPWCGHIGMRKLHQKYSRFIVDWVDGAPKDYSVEISCYVCTNPACRRKQAYLPDAIVPYAQYSFLFIMQVLQVYYERMMTVDEICETFGITRRRVYRWVDRFRDDLVALLSFHVIVGNRQVQCICFHLLLQRMTFSEFCERYLQMTRNTPLQIHPVLSIVHTRADHDGCRLVATALPGDDAVGTTPETQRTVRPQHSGLARPPTLSHSFWFCR